MRARVSVENTAQPLISMQTTSKHNLKQSTDGVTPLLLQMENLKRKGATVTNRKTNQVMYICEICEKCKKDMVFATKHDLNIHVERVHGKTPPYVS